MQRVLTLIGCGKQKVDHPAPAKDLYTGSQFKGARQAAEALGYPWAVFSAGHGVCDPDEVIDTYDRAPLRNPDEATPTERLRIRLALAEWDLIIALTTRTYTAMAERAAPGKVIPVLAGTKGMGYQRAIFVQIRDTGRLPEPHHTRLLEAVRV